MMTPLGCDINKLLCDLEACNADTNDTPTLPVASNNDCSIAHVPHVPWHMHHHQSPCYPLDPHHVIGHNLYRSARYGSNTSAWASNQISGLQACCSNNNGMTAFASNAAVFAVNTAAYASNQIGNALETAYFAAYASNTSTWTSNNFSNYAGKQNQSNWDWASNTSAWTSNRAVVHAYAADVPTSVNNTSNLGKFVEVVKGPQSCNIYFVDANGTSKMIFDADGMADGRYGSNIATWLSNNLPIVENVSADPMPSNNAPATYGTFAVNGSNGSVHFIDYTGRAIKLESPYASNTATWLSNNLPNWSNVTVDPPAANNPTTTYGTWTFNLLNSNVSYIDYTGRAVQVSRTYDSNTATWASNLAMTLSNGLVNFSNVTTDPAATGNAAATYGTYTYNTTTSNIYYIDYTGAARKIDGPYDSNTAAWASNLAMTLSNGLVNFSNVTTDPAATGNAATTYGTYTYNTTTSNIYYIDYTGAARKIDGPYDSNTAAYSSNVATWLSNNLAIWSNTTVDPLATGNAASTYGTFTFNTANSNVFFIDYAGRAVKLQDDYDSNTAAWASNLAMTLSNQLVFWSNVTTNPPLTGNAALTYGTMTFNTTNSNIYYIDYTGAARPINNTYWTSSNSNVWTFSNVGIGTVAPKVDLDVYGEVSSCNVHTYRHVYGNYGMFWRNDGAGFYLMSTASGNQYGGYTSNRPFYYNLQSGQVQVNHGVIVESPLYAYGKTSTSINSLYRKADSNYALWVASRGDTGTAGQCNTHYSMVVTGGGDYNGDGGGIHFNLDWSGYWENESMAYIRGVHAGIDSANKRNAGGLAFHVRECLTFASGAASTNAATYTEAMRISHNANVGIGTTAPVYKLDVAGNIRGSNVYAVGPATASYYWSNTSGSARMYLNSTTLYLDGTSNDISISAAVPRNFVARAMTINGDSNFIGFHCSPDITKEYNIRSYGNFCIANGPGSPGILTSNLPTTAADDDGEAGSIDFATGRNTRLGYEPIARIESYLTSVDTSNTCLTGHLRFFTRSNGVKQQLLERMIIRDNGNVGIDITAPFYKLDVAGTTRVYDLRVENRAGGTARSTIRIDNSVSTAFSVIGSAIASDWTNGATANDLVLANYASNAGILIGSAWPMQSIGATGPIGLYVNESNNVGIGTTTPGVKFQVNGDGMTLYNAVDNRPRFYMYNAFRPQRPYIMASCASNNDFMVGATPGDSVLATTDELNSLLIGHAYNNVTGFGINSNAVICCAPNYKVGIGGILNPGVTLDVNGSVRGTGFITASDERLKEEIVLANIDQCYDNIKNLPLKYYKWRDDIQPYDKVQDRHRVGWIAQDVQTIFPKAVHVIDSYGIKDMLSLDTNQITAAMYGAIQKLQQVVEDQAFTITNYEVVMAQQANAITRQATIIAEHSTKIADFSDQSMQIAALKKVVEEQTQKLAIMGDAISNLMKSMSQMMTST